ncbi:MAG: beta-ketoacyl-ACP synthase II [Bacillota bacterium]|nr:beta-ketoacyl-ACP synthase II [Bacillota bacterium]
MKHRVVVTGLGPVTPLGLGRKVFWEALVGGKSGVGPITLMDTSDYPVHIAAEVKDFQPEQFLERREARHMDRFTQFAVAAAQLALDDSGLKLDRLDRERAGVLIGAGIGGIQTLYEQMRVLLERGPGRISPYLVPMMILDMAAGQVSIRFGFKGPNSAAVSACASASHAIGEAFKWIQRGECDVMVTGGAEAAISPPALAGFCAAHSLSTRNAEPERASRPFDRDRDGFVMGEGAGILILESLEHARARQARIYAEIIGYGSTGDAYNVVAPEPNGDGAYRAMAMALRDAGLSAAEVDYINAHGTATQVGDVAETLAIKRLLGGESRACVSSTKSMTGHLLGAAGGVEAIATVLTLYEGVAPPTINLENQDPACDLDCVPNVARWGDFRVALSNSFGFGGHNAVLAFRRWAEDEG